jgi:GNAT superfamily N-acetyltransferase
MGVPSALGPQQPTCAHICVYRLPHMSDPVIKIRLANSIKDIPAICKLDTLFQSAKKQTQDANTDTAVKSFDVRYLTTDELDMADREQIFALFESNMKAHYMAAWGWNPVEKRDEIFHPMARFLLIHQHEDAAQLTTQAIERESSSVFDVHAATAGTVATLEAATVEHQIPHRRTIVGYTVFRFEWDDDEEPEHPVLYCYELQVSKTVQGHGVGRQIMSLLVQIADKLKLWKVLLTCFTVNTHALKFYRNIGFDTDVNSPIAQGFPADYEIMSNRPTLR